jgi:Zn-finger nucleic acid-binding protein
VSSLLCPHCRTALAPGSHEGARFDSCPSCRGVAVNVALLRQFAPPQRVRAIWLNLPDGQPGPPCPSCARPLVDTAAPAGLATIRLGVCRPCQVIWFDAGELAAFSPQRAAPAPKPREFTPQAEEAVALERIAAKERDEKEESDARFVLRVLNEIFWSL